MQDIAISKANQQRRLVIATEHLLGICSGIISDNHIHPSEIEFLNNWLNSYPDVMSKWPGSAIHSCIQAILADGVITKDEQDHLLETLKGITGNTFNETGTSAPEIADIPYNDDPHIMLPGMCYCFTGRFMYGTRSACEKLVERRGATTLDNVITSLDYLVVGSMVEPSWLHTSYGRKIATAIKYNEKGHGISIIKESDWHAATMRSAIVA